MIADGASGTRQEHRRPIDIGVAALTGGVRIATLDAAESGQEPEVHDRRVIVSGKGTIRGKKHGVRKKLEVITAVGKYAKEDELLLRLYEGELRRRTWDGEMLAERGSRFA